MAIFRTIPTGDLELQAGTFVLIDGIRQLRQRLASRFQFAKGEWFLDLRQGIPYFQDVLRKDPNLGLIRSIFRRVILTTPGVVGIKAFDIRYDEAARRLSFAFHAQGTEGDVRVSFEDDDFIVSVAP